MRNLPRTGFSMLGWALCGWFVWLLIGCASQASTPVHPAHEEIQSDADRFFDKLETEEKRQGGSGGSDR